MSSPMACFNIEIPKKPANKSASEHRRATKPIMEKRRRARINHSLNELKSLILDALNKDPTRNSKLEKADILEMTVKHLQNLQRQQMALEVTRDPTVLSKYRAGFTECATEVSRYVNKIDGVDNGMKQRLINHLSTCVQALPASTNAPATPSGSFNPSFQFLGMSAFPGQSPLQVHIPTAGNSSSVSTSSDLNNNRRIESMETKLTPPASASSAFSFSFPSNASLSPMTPSTPSTPSSIAGGYHHQEMRFAPYKMSSVHPWASRRDVLRSVSPGSSSSSMGSLSPTGSDSVDCESTHSDKNSQGGDVWRPW